MATATSPWPTVEGTVAPGFERVREEFERNFSERGELGAACAAYVGGEKVVDLWGGVRDARYGAPWNEDTLVLVYSTSKEVVVHRASSHTRARDDLVRPDGGVAALREELTGGADHGGTRGLPALGATVPLG